MRPLSGRGPSRPTAGRSLGRPVSEGSTRGRAVPPPCAARDGTGTAARTPGRRGAGWARKAGPGGEVEAAAGPPRFSSPQSPVDAPLLTRGRLPLRAAPPGAAPRARSGAGAAAAAAPRGGTCGGKERPGCRAEVSEPGGGQGPAVPGAAGKVSGFARPAGLRRVPTRAPPATRPSRAGPGWAGSPRRLGLVLAA